MEVRTYFPARQPVISKLYAGGCQAFGRLLPSLWKFASPRLKRRGDRPIMKAYRRPRERLRSAEAGRLTGMVEELLEFTRLRDGRFTLNVEEVERLLAEAKEAGDFNGLDIEPWMERLENAEYSFLTATDEKVQEEAAREVGLSKQARQAADDAYRKLVDIVNMLAAMHGDEKFATFIGNVNALVEQQRTKLKTRATNSAKKEDEGVIKF